MQRDARTVATTGRRARVLAALVGLLAPLIAAGCGGDVVSLDPVAAAAGKTKQAGSFRMDYLATVSMPGGPLQSFEFGGEGVFDCESRAGRMTFEAVLPADVERELGGRMRGELVFDGLVMYMRFPLLAGELPAGKSWVKLDLQALAEEQGFDVQTLLQTSQADPIHMLDLLSSGEAEQLGYDTVRGVATTRYRLELDTVEMLGRVPASARAGLKRMTEELRLEAMPVEVWVDDDGLLRRLRMGWTQSDPLSAGRTLMTMSVTQELYDFGVPVDVKPPPADQVVDAAALGAG